MVLKRYTRSPIIGGGKQYGTSLAASDIKRATDDGTLTTRVRVLQGAERLDTIAGRELGDASLWWVIAAASGIGWALQVPPGTRIVVPIDIAQVADIIG